MDNITLIGRAFDELWFGQSDRATIHELIHPDHRFVFMDTFNGAPETGIAGYQNVLFGFSAAFPDFRATMREPVVEQGSRMVNPWVFSGTHLGGLGPFAPTGKRIEVAGLDIHRIEGGLIAETMVYCDNLGMLQGLGIVDLENVAASPP